MVNLEKIVTVVTHVTLDPESSTLSRTKLIPGASREHLLCTHWVSPCTHMQWAKMVLFQQESRLYEKEHSL